MIERPLAEEAYTTGEGQHRTVSVYPVCPEERIEGWAVIDAPKPPERQALLVELLMLDDHELGHFYNGFLSDRRLEALAILADYHQQARDEQRPQTVCICDPRRLGITSHIPPVSLPITAPDTVPDDLLTRPSTTETTCTPNASTSRSPVAARR